MPAIVHRTPYTVDSNSGHAVRVLQITDPHLMADASGSLLGVNTRDSFNAVLQCAQSRFSNPDLLLATGDLSQDGSAAAYHEFARKTSVFKCPASWVAGNHDDREMLAEIAELTGASHRHLLAGEWQIVMLDSSVGGQVHGYVSEVELSFLESALAAYRDRPALVCLHHHPVAVGTAWMENIGLYNRDAFWSVIDRFPQVKAVLWGHIHQELDRYRGDIRLLATPSTCIQFEAGSDEFSVEKVGPGFRWLELQPDGTLETGVVRAHDFSYDLDIDSGGY